MAAIDEIERAFALADPAVTDEKDADAVDVEQARMHRDLRRHRLFEKVSRARDRDRGKRGRRKKRDGALLALLFEFVERCDALRDDETRHVERRDIAHALLAKARRQRLEILRLRLADDLPPPLLDVFVIAGEREARLLHARTQDRAVETVVAGDQLPREIVEIARNERAHRRSEERRV